MAQTSESQSSGGEKSEDGSILVPFTLRREYLHRETGFGSFFLEMPSLVEDISKIHKNPYPKVVLLVNDKDKNQKECLKIIRDLNHENILRVEFWEEVSNEPHIRVYVEPYTAIISELFQNFESLINPRTNMIPSQSFEEIVSATMSALDYIRDNNQYHGNFSWKTTFYHLVNGNVIVKLANFERKNSNDLLQCQVEDVTSLGASLEALSQHLKDNYPNVKNYTYCLIDDLARKLKSVTKDSIGTVKRDLQDHEFFWDEKRTKIFFAYEVLGIWNDTAIQNRFRLSPSMPTLPWTAAWASDPLMVEMERYRSNNGLGDYDGESLADFFRFISGMYTHENELRKTLKNEKLSIDAEVRKKYPSLCHDLNAAIRGDA